MKRIVTIALSVILFGLAQTALAQFTLKTDKDTIKIYPGETAVFTIGFDIQNGYDASILLSLVSGKPLMQNGGGTLSTRVVNTPYDAVKLTVKTTATFTQSGVYQFRVDGTNTGISSSVVCYVEVVASPKTNWRIKTASKPMGGIPEYIMQDSQNNYWFNVRDKELQSVIHGTPLDQWKGDDTTHLGYSDFPPVVDYKANRVWLPGRSYNLITKYITVYPVDLVQSIVLDTNTGTVWVAGRRGLASYSKGKWTMYDTTNSVLRGPVLGLALSGSTVWVGNYDALVKYDGTTWTKFTVENSGLPARGPKVMAAESNGDVWVALNDAWQADNLAPYYTVMIGLSKFDGVSWTVYNYHNSPLHSSNVVNSVAIDKKGNKWIATSLRNFDGFNFTGTGILKFDNKEWTSYSKDNSPLPDNEINWVGVDNDDNVWFTQNLLNVNNHPSFWGVFNENGLPFPLAPTSVEEQPIDNPNTDGSIILSPNPVSTSFTFSGIEGVTAITIVNSLGMEVMQCSMENMGSTIDVSGLPNGVYFVQLRTATGMMTRPVVVSH